MFVAARVVSDGTVPNFVVLFVNSLLDCMWFTPLQILTVHHPFSCLLPYLEYMSHFPGLVLAMWKNHENSPISEQTDLR